MRRFMRLSVLVVFLFATSCAAQDHLGNYVQHELHPDGVTIHATGGTMDLWCAADGIVRVRVLRPGESPPDSSFVVFGRDWPATPVDFQESDSGLVLRATGICVSVGYYPISLSISRLPGGGELMRTSSCDAFGWNGTAPFARFEISADEHFYGLGEKRARLDRLGGSFSGYNSHSETNIAIPWLLSSRGFGVYFDVTWPHRFDLGRSRSDRWEFRAEGGPLEFYVVAGESMAQVLERYTWLTGYQPMPPRWALGFLQSKYGYRDESETRAVAAEMRRRAFPCDAIILDLYWFGQPDDMGNLEWDLARWPNPRSLLADLEADGFKTLLIHEPYFTTRSKYFTELAAEGLFGRTTTGEPYVFHMWAGSAGLLDLTNPRARIWLWEHLRPLVDQGVDSWWTDLGEPETHPDDMLHYLGSARQVHNIFNLLWSRAITEGYERDYPDRRYVILTRSGFAGMQRYSTVPWSGDVERQFSGLGAQLPMVQDMGLSGVAYHNSDIGGFHGGFTTPELYVRWMQYGAFCPVTRAHGVGQPTEPWAFGPEAEAICKKYLMLRYRLLPYLYTLAWQNHRTGMPLARALALEFPQDARAPTMDDQYLVGPSLLVAPVAEQGRTSRPVYLPEGEWVDFWTDTLLEGPTTIEYHAPLSTLPLLVRRGAILPLQSAMAWSNQRPLDTLTVEIYPDRLSEFLLYEDDGVTTAYRQGEFATTRLWCSASDTELLAGAEAATGNFSGLPDRRTWYFRFHLIKNGPQSVTDNTGQPMAFFEDSLAFAGATRGWFYESERHLVVAKLERSIRSPVQLSATGHDLLAAVGESGPSRPFDFALRVYPNPASDEVTVLLSSPVRLRVERVVLFDILGRKVAEAAVSARSPMRFRLSNLPVGLYFVRVMGGNYAGTIKLLVLR